MWAVRAARLTTTLGSRFEPLARREPIDIRSGVHALAPYNKYESNQPMNMSFLFRALAVGFIFMNLSACGPAQQNIADPGVKGDKSTIKGDTKATQFQKSESE
jgi:hypothetical protein